MIPAVANTVFTIKRGDTRPPLEITGRDATGAVIDMTGGLSITFQMKLRQHLGNAAFPSKVDAAGTFVDAVNGKIDYTFVAADTDEVGEYAGEFIYVASDGEPRTIPNPGFITVRVVQDIE